jgi:hypothetical protein
MLLLGHIDGVRVEEDFPLLWMRLLRENQLLPGYDPKTDPLYKL